MMLKKSHYIPIGASVNVIWCGFESVWIVWYLQNPYCWTLQGAKNVNKSKFIYFLHMNDWCHRTFFHVHWEVPDMMQNLSIGVL